MKSLVMRLKRLKGLPPGVILKKAVCKAYKKIYYNYRKLELKNNNIFLSDNCFYNFQTDCKFFYTEDNKNYYVSLLDKLNCFAEISQDADNISNHYFNLLGSELKYLGEKLPWNQDFKSGFIWDNKFYKDIKVIDLSNNADVKVPWELSRFQHLFTLGKAYWIKNDEKYALEFKDEIEDWIIKNPFEMSVNWTCTMDTAIRAINLICGCFFFQKSNSLDNGFWIKINKLLYYHGEFIYRNLENQRLHNGNHYISDLAGLIWLGIYFKKFSFNNKKKNSPQNWLDLGLKEFENEMQKEVNKDGTDYEASTSYHRLVTEIFLFTAILCNKNNIFFSKEYMNKLEKMCDFIMLITKPNGLSPIIGDADDGRLVILSDYGNWRRRDFRYLLAAAGEYFNRDDFRGEGIDHKEDALWLMGSFKEVKNEPDILSKGYADGGYYILKNKRIYCIIRCGELSCRGEGGHSHNDQLSIELNIDGEDFFIDPGTYVYTADYRMRNEFRSTGSHNTVSIKKLEQNYFNPFDLFFMKEETFAGCNEFSQNTFCGEHYGYVKKCGLIHKRNLAVYSDKIVIYDSLENASGNLKDNFFNSNECVLNFILDSGVEIIRKENGIELIKNGRKIFMVSEGNYRIKDFYISYRYGHLISAKKIEFNIKLQNEMKIYLSEN